MQLEGSCHCGAVKFQVESAHPYPFNVCYCSICRKTTGAGGYAINLSAHYPSLQVQGRDAISVYSAQIEDAASGETRLSSAQRSFCSRCGSHLWAYDPRWPELVHPLASVIDTQLPQAPEHTHLMLGSKPSWVPVHAGPKDRRFDAYPDESIAAWHERLGLQDS